MVKKYEKRVILVEIIKFSDFMSKKYQIVEVIGITENEQRHYDNFIRLAQTILVAIFMLKFAPLVFTTMGGGLMGYKM